MLRRGFKRKLLLFLATLGDLYSEFSLDTFYKKLYYPDYKPRSIVQMLSRMAKVGEISKEIIKGEVVFKIKTRGLKLLDETILLKKLKEKEWDKIWRIVIFDIPEKNRPRRDILRWKLRDLGFGKWQKSVYITPHPVTSEINEFLQNEKLFPRAFCLEARRSGLGDDKKLAAFVFKLERLNTKYLRVAEEADFLLSKIKKEGREKERKEELWIKFKELWEQYEEILFTDPHLPRELLPDNWVEEEAKKNLISLVKELQS